MEQKIALNFKTVNSANYMAHRLLMAPSKWLEIYQTRIKAAKDSNALIFPEQLLSLNQKAIWFVHAPELLKGDTPSVDSVSVTVSKIYFDNIFIPKPGNRSYYRHERDGHPVSSIEEIVEYERMNVESRDATKFPLIHNMIGNSHSFYSGFCFASKHGALKYANKRLSSGMGRI